ncbi:hypothetical protein G6R29_04930 [Fructobacillus sp. M2-14]|uniref:Uncharacterized protein n=1 Tax=Fructobacillus broussonetiae TaxID=2713173 RepID=A0ABS5R0J1_9LACO|nr:hypothetical protein [Fructobacillus broussonetiae]MBS9338968.1 hypothetical protein [Fructobacillus broussonetiae]
MKLFKWSKQDQQVKEDQSQLELLQAENDELLGQIESLKLDVTELEVEKAHLEDVLSRSGYKKRIIRIGLGLLVLVVTYAGLVLVGERSTNLPWLLLIEAAFIFFMGRGDDK